MDLAETSLGATDKGYKDFLVGVLGVSMLEIAGNDAPTLRAFYPGSWEEYLDHLDDMRMAKRDKIMEMGK